MTWKAHGDVEGWLGTCHTTELQIAWQSEAYQKSATTKAEATRPGQGEQIPLPRKTDTLRSQVEVIISRQLSVLLPR